MKSSQLVKIIKEEVDDILSEKSNRQEQEEFASRMCADKKLRARVIADHKAATDETRKQILAMFMLQSKMKCPQVWR
jgi:hypothetical protein